LFSTPPKAVKVGLARYGNWVRLRGRVSNASLALSGLTLSTGGSWLHDRSWLQGWGRGGGW